MNKLDEIKDYFSKQNDWNTLTEFEYFKWLIGTIEKYQEDVEIKNKQIELLRRSNRDYQKAFEDCFEGKFKKGENNEI